MSFSWGARSQAKLADCDPRLQELCDWVIQHTPIDVAIIHGWRSQAEQDEAVATGNSGTPWPTSKHNHEPSLAIDFAPWPVDWKDTHSFAVVAGVFFAGASALDIPIRWGGDWDGDGSTRDQSLMDWGHIELL